MTSHLQIKRVPVLGAEMAVRESGDPDGPVVLFVHGNPSSSIIWRNIIPYVQSQARCIAPDLIGFGLSDKPDLDYRFADHVRYLDALIETLKLDRFYLVAQDWGTALALHFAARFESRVLGLALMEFIWPAPDWESLIRLPAARELFQRFRIPETGEQLVMEQNVFVEQVMLGQMDVDEAVRQAYRAPFPTPASRKPVWRFPNELPVAGQPADVAAMLTQAHAALRAARYPKLLFAGNPGALVSPEHAAQLAGELRNCRLVQLPGGRHYLQEDFPDEIGSRLARWLRDLQLTQTGLELATA